MAEWPDSVPVLFIDGPLAGEVYPAPARAGMPVMMLRVRRSDSRVEVRSARDQAPGAGWASYLGLGAGRRRAGRRAGENDGAAQWLFVYSE